MFNAKTALAKANRKLAIQKATLKSTEEEIEAILQTPESEDISLAVGVLSAKLKRQQNAVKATEALIRAYQVGEVNEELPL